MPRIRRERTHVAAAVAAIPLLAPILIHANLAFARGGPYLPPETPARREMVEDNPFAGGQPSDLTFKVESVTFLGPPCPTDKKILQHAEIVIEVGWIKSISYFGQLCIQAEGSDSTDGDDQIVFEINGRGRWTVASVKRDGVDVFGGAAPEGENGGNGTWDGVKLTPPSSFESGKYQAGSGPKQTMRYTITLDYHPLPGDLCKTVGFLLRGYYLHTYDGSFEWSCSNALSVGAGYPWGVSLGGTVNVTNDHAWQKQLVNPVGEEGNHTASYEPGAVWVPSEECCPAPDPEPEPEPSIDDSDTDNDGTPNGFEETTSFHFTNGNDLASATVEVVARTPNGFEVARNQAEVALPCRGGCSVTIPFALPLDYPFDSMVVETLLYGDEGGTDSVRKVVPVNIGAHVPELSAASGLPDGHLLVPDMLLVHLFDPQVPPPIQAQITTLVVFNQAGAVRDQEQGMFSGNPQWTIQMPVQSALQGPTQPMNGVLSVATGDTVVVSYQGPQGVLMNSIAVNDRIEAIQPSAAAQPSSTALRLEGTSTGATWAIGVGFEDGSGQIVTFAAPPGASASEVAELIQSELAGAGVQLSIGPDGAMHVFGPADTNNLFAPLSDPGMDILPASLPTPDLNGDGVVDPNDLAMLLGSWGGGGADLNGDGTTNAADLAVLLGAWS